MTTTTDTAAELSTWETMMVAYGSAHQNRTNVIMHIIGVPVIVLGVMAMTATFNAAILVALLGAALYMRLDLQLGAFAAAALVLLAVGGQAMAATMGTSTAAITGAAMFVGGFIFQFVGHAIEGRKPALMNGNPVTAMLTAPLFVVAELVFFAGGRHDLEVIVTREIAKLEVLPVAA